MRTPLTAPLILPQLPQPGLPGAYSVELVSLSLVSPPNSNLTQLLLQATWHLFLRHLVTMVVAVCLSFFGLVSDLSSQVPRRRWSQPRSGSHTHSTKSTHEKCERLFFFLTLSFLLQPFPTHGFIKYSIPQPPGRQSVEVVSSLGIKSC